MNQKSVVGMQLKQSKDDKPWHPIIEDLLKDSVDLKAAGIYKEAIRYIIMRLLKKLKWLLLGGNYETEGEVNTYWL